MNTTKERTDIHRPSAINPSDYRYAESMDLEWPLGLADKGEGGLYELLERHENSESAPYQGNPGKCDHCGANLRYVVFWEHLPTGDVITTGETCARETMEIPSRLLLDQKRLRDTAAARRALVRENAEVTERQERAKYYFPEAYEILHDYQGDNPFIADVARRFGRNGYLTENQAKAVVRSVKEAAERERQRAIDAANATPAPEGKNTITGEVLSVKSHENDFGHRLVMTVRDDRGFKVWGTVPRSLEFIDADDGNVTYQRTVDKGDRVSFSATLTRSDKDESFAFFKRPTKAKLLEG